MHLYNRWAAARVLPADLPLDGIKKAPSLLQRDEALKPRGTTLLAAPCARPLGAYQAICSPVTAGFPGSAYCAVRRAAPGGVAQPDAAASHFPAAPCKLPCCYLAHSLHFYQSIYLFYIISTALSSLFSQHTCFFYRRAGSVRCWRFTGRGRRGVSEKSGLAVAGVGRLASA